MPAPDASQGDVRGGVLAAYIGHATVLLEIGGVRVLTDPFLRDRLGPLERHGPAPDLEALGEVDLVVISHGHPDHFDRPSLRLVPGRPVLVVPRGLGAAASQAVTGDVIEVQEGEEVTVRGIDIRAVPAHHWISPGAPRARPLGYVIGGAATPRIYFAGDTGRVDHLRTLTGTVDVALLPVWTWGPHLGPGHLGPRTAADVAADLDATVAIPIHWGTLYPRRLHRVWRSPLDEPGDRFAAHLARIAPAIDVRVLRPGGSTVIDRSS